MTNYDTIIGIDPGISNGGIAILRNGKEVSVKKMPKTPEGFIELMKYYNSISKNIIVFLEQINLRPQDTKIPGKAIVMQKLLNHVQHMKSIFLAFDIRCIEVHPLTWQRGLHLVTKEVETDTERKNRYKAFAQIKAPHIKCTNWNADAILILLYGIKNIKLYQNDNN